MITVHLLLIPFPCTNFSDGKKQFCVNASFLFVSDERELGAEDVEEFICVMSDLAGEPMSTMAAIGASSVAKNKRRIMH